jgi:hypothetical protein
LDTLPSITVPIETLARMVGVYEIREKAPNPRLGVAIKEAGNRSIFKDLADCTAKKWSD